MGGKSWRNTAFAISVAVLLVLVGGFGFARGAQEAEESGGPKVAVVVKTLTGDVFQLKMAEAARDRAVELGADARIYQAGGQTAVQEMVSIIEDLIVQEVDVILISPLDAKAVVPAFREAKAAGITTVCMDQSAEGDDFVTFISTDNYKAGAMAAEYAKDYLGGSGNVLVVEGAPGSSVGDQRRDGFSEAVIEGSNIEIVGSQSGFWQNDKALEATQNMLQANPDVDLIFSCSDVMVGGILEAVKLAGRENEIDVISFDGSKFGVNLILEGQIIADVAQFPVRIGRRAAEVGVGVYNGTVSEDELPEFIDVGAELVTAENAEDFLPNAF